MASMTHCGTCVPPGPSRNAAGCPLTVWASEGNWERTQVRSRVVGASVSVAGMGFMFLGQMAFRSRVSKINSELLRWVPRFGIKPINLRLHNPNSYREKPEKEKCSGVIVECHVSTHFYQS